jgi:hypothetical protein
MRKKSYIDYLQDLEDLEEKDRTIFFKLKQSKEIHCKKFNKLCLFVTGKNENCFKKCRYYRRKIKPLEKKSLQMLVKIADKKKEIKTKFGDLDNIVQQ